MDQFQDGCYVRLLSRAYGTYLTADEDGKGVSLHPQGKSLNTTWVVHLLFRDGVPDATLLLHSAAYGRYLASSDELAPMGLRGHLLAQVDYEYAEQYEIRWLPAPSPSSSGNDVRLRHLYRRGHLCANGATVHAGYDSCEKMDWAVETVPQGERADRHHQPQKRPFLERILGFFWPAQRQEPMTRTIRFRRQFSQNSEVEEWRSMHLSGRSLSNLANKLINIVGKGYVICVQAGCFGRLTPLLVDLPHNRDAIDLVLLPIETQEIGDPSSSAKIVTPNGQTFEVGLGLSIADELLDHVLMQSLKKAGNFKSPETYLWLVSSGQEAREAIQQWNDCGRPDNAAVDLSEKLIFKDMEEILLSFENLNSTELAKQSADYARLIREYRAMVSISKLPCPPKEVAARFSDRNQKSSFAVEPWVMLNVEH